MNRIIVCLALASIFAGEYGCQPEEDIFGRDSCPIINGEPDTSPEHMAVVYMQMVEGNMMSACSGTLIAPRIVLTAAHCVYGMGPDSVTVYFGNSSTIGAQARHVSDVIWHPSYNPRNLPYDVAMVRLSTNPPAGIEPIPFLPHSMGITSSDIGTPLEFVGFGLTETGATGTKMTVINRLDWICTTPGGCNFGGLHAATNTICQDQNPGGPCTGDSGGPALIIRLAREYVCGITSYGDAPECEYYGCSTKVDEFEDFILSFAGDPNGTPCVENVDCLSNACADGFCCENSCPGRCEACNQPGSLGLCVTLSDGTPCPDSDVCNGEETCSDGSCQMGEPLVCHDEIGCTADTCDPGRGCDFKPLAADCDDQEICTRDLCDLQLGCVHQPLEDGLECAKNMICQAGVCKKDPSLEDGCGCASTETGAFSMLLLLGFLALLARGRGANRAA